MVQVINTHITQYSAQKSLVRLSDLKQAGGTNLLAGETGRVYSIFIAYTDATAAYVKLYNLDGSLTHGTDHPIMVIPVKGTSFSTSIISQSGVYVSSGLSMAASSHAGTGSGGANPAGTVTTFISGT